MNQLMKLSAVIKRTLRLSVMKRRGQECVAQLNQFDQTRLNTAAAWLSRSRPGLWLMNGAIAATLTGVSAARLVKNVLSKNIAVSGTSQDLELQQTMLPGQIQQQPRVLLLVEQSIPQCFHYRVQQKLEQLKKLGWYAQWLPWSETEQAKQRMHYVDVVIFYRAPGFPKVLAAIDYAQQLGKVVCYDVDDLIFDRERLAEKFTANSAQLSDKDLQDILNGADLYRQAAALCSYGIASTPSLQQQLAVLVGQKHCFLLPNGLDSTINGVASLPMAVKKTDRLTLFYGSGTKTHDEDFALIAEALVKVLKQYQQVHLVIAGHLTLPTALEGYSERIQRLPLLDFSSYLYCLRQADIALAPLEPGLFADCKSEIKWLEAAVMGVPCVVSRTERYEQVVEHGETGMLAADEQQWFAALESLITDAGKRQQMAQAAATLAQKNYGETAMAKQMSDVLQQAQQRSIEAGQLGEQSDKQRLLLVNVLYPPQAIGGATTVVENIAAQLRQDYADKYEVSVLSCEVNDNAPYTLREYVHDGVNVTIIAVPYSIDLETKPSDPHILKLCLDWLPQNRPDLIHFHSMQRLTASVLEAAHQLSIPYWVTVHDAWWFSEHQFLLDKQHCLLDEQQLNPLLAVQHSNEPAAAVQRAQYLAVQLQQAQQILAVSEYQAQLYRSNGFQRVVVNRNGVDGVASVANLSTPLASGTVSPGPLRIGYLGGMSAHKGYDFLKSIVEQQSFHNLKFVVVDLFKPRHYRAHDNWGASKVDFVGKYKADSIDEFYQQVDVLIAPSIWPESFGLVSREAALQGVWVVAADAGGMAEDIIEGKTGFVFPMRDAERCRDILVELDQKYEYFQTQGPDVKLSQDKIVSLQQHVAELVGYIQN